MRWDEVRLLVIDTETTGTSVEEDRIVELGAAYFDGGRPEGLRRTLIHPGRPIPAEASAVHGITDEHVRDAPPFDAVGPRFAAHLDGSALDGDPPILAGYNAIGFDVPLLNTEFARAGLEVRIEPTRVLDLLVFVRWFHRGLRSRRLEEVCARYGVPLEDAHSAAVDAAASGFLLYPMVDAGIIPADVREALALQAHLLPRLDEEWLRWSYWLYEDRDSGDLRMGAGKYCGQPLDRVEPDYLGYLMRKVPDLPDAVRDAFARRLRG